MLQPPISCAPCDAAAARELSQAFALAVPHAESLRIRDDVAFFQAVQAVLATRAPGAARPEEDIAQAVRQIISRAVATESVIDVFEAAGCARRNRLSPWARSRLPQANSRR